jgi:hypothetical protein
MIIIYSKPLRLGAQEKDSINGVRLFGDIVEDIIEVIVDLTTDKINFNDSNLQLTSNKGSYKSSIELYIKFILCKLFIWDPALRQTIRLSYFKLMQALSISYPKSLVVTEGCNLLPLTFFSKSRISRSHNFEPVHAYKEQKRVLFGIFYFIVKIQSIVMERLLTNIIAISDRDANLFKLIPSRKKIIVVPLRDLVVENRIFKPMVLSKIMNRNIAYLSSTYNVHHNKKGLDFFVNNVFNSLDMKDIVFNVYGSKAPNQSYCQNIKIHGWVENLDEIYIENDVFLCSNGGTGQQSKIFEPLAKGKILICNPKLLIGYELIPEIHYLAAVSAYDFKSQIHRVFNNPENFDQLRVNAFKYCVNHFSYTKNLAKLGNFIEY